MSSFKMKPLSEQSIHMTVVGEAGDTIEDRVINLGDYFDLTIPDNGYVKLENAPPPDPPAPPADTPQAPPPEDPVP